MSSFFNIWFMDTHSTVEKNILRYIEEFHHNYYKYDDNILSQLTFKLGFEGSYEVILFPNGINQFYKIVSAYYDKKMLDILSKQELSTSITERIFQASMTRIKVMDQKLCKKIYMHHFKLQNNFCGLSVLYRTCDEIWKYAGDKSTNYNHYSKRTLLLTAILPTIFYYIHDSSEGFIETENFLYSSLAKISNIASIKSLIKAPKIENIPFLRMIY